MSFVTICERNTAQIKIQHNKKRKKFKKETENRNIFLQVKKKFKKKISGNVFFNLVELVVQILNNFFMQKIVFNKSYLNLIIALIFLS